MKEKLGKTAAKQNFNFKIGLCSQDCVRTQGSIEKCTSQYPHLISFLKMQHKVQLGIKYLQITISCFPETPLKLGHIKKKKWVHSMQGWTATTRYGVTRKRSTRRLKHSGNLLRKKLQLNGVC